MTDSAPAARADRVEPRRVRGVDHTGPEYLVTVRWDAGETDEVDLAPLVFAYEVLRPLRDLDRFATVTVGEFGYGLAWPGSDDWEVSPEQLSALAEQQRGPGIRPSFLRRWMARRNLTQDDVAAMLRLSKRTVAAYAVGKAGIDWVTSLALGSLVGHAAPDSGPDDAIATVRTIERSLAGPASRLAP